MHETNHKEYFRLCLSYRTITVALCTLIYLLPLADNGGDPSPKLWIACGMLLACVLSNALYQYTFQQGGQDGWVRILLALELIAYGIFTFLSGGLSSPYLWYYIGCLFMMLAFKQNALFAVLGGIWCGFCVLASHLNNPGRRAFDHLERNLTLGAAVIIGAFYILLHYIRRLGDTQEQQRRLNLQLRQEKERSEQALLHITDLYDTLNLFAMTDPHRVMHALALTLWRTIAPDGCILLKYGTEGKAERQEVCGVSDAHAAALIEAAADLGFAGGGGWQNLMCPAVPAAFEGMRIGGNSCAQGVFIRSKGRARAAQQQDSFYRGVIEIIFRNLDTHKQLEAYIATEEKNRLANEIHDTVIQKLFGLVCGLKLLEDSIAPPQEESLKKQLRMLKQSAELTMKELREAIYGRRFENGDGATFLGQLRLYMEEMERLSGARIRLDIDEAAGDMTASQKIALYRISCEAVNNAVRHGQAKIIDIRLRLGAQYIRMEIKDDGIGVVETPNMPYCGNGLRNMNRMAALLNGQFRLESQKNKGTTVKLRLPR